MLPHLKDRPLTLTRYPNGIDGAVVLPEALAVGVPEGVPASSASTIYSSTTTRDGEYILVNNLQTLIWLAQLADLEIHAWMARVNPEPDAHRPADGVLRIGSEPRCAACSTTPTTWSSTSTRTSTPAREKKGEEPALNRRAFEKTREMAFSLKELLEQLRLSSFVKTTGKTGLHIYVPVLRQYTYDEIRAASAADRPATWCSMHPDDLTMEWQTQKRTGKIFFDHNQNTRGKTLAAQYSLRPSPRRGVSAPVTWEELARVYPTDFDIDTEPERLAKIGDLWAGHPRLQAGPEGAARRLSARRSTWSNNQSRAPACHDIVCPRPRTYSTVDRGAIVSGGTIGPASRCDRITRARSGCRVAASCRARSRASAGGAALYAIGCSSSTNAPAPTPAADAIRPSPTRRSSRRPSRR